MSHIRLDQPLKICFVSLNAYPLFDPTVDGPMGGMESRAWIFARQLAQCGSMEVGFVVRDHGQGAVRQFDNISVYAWREPTVKRFMRLALGHRGAGGTGRPLPDDAAGPRPLSRLGGLSLRVARALGRLARQLLSGVATGPALLARIPAPVFLTFGVHELSAEIIGICRRLGRKCIVCLASDGDVDEVFVTTTNDQRRDGVPASVGHFVLTHADEIVVQSRRQLTLLRERFGRTGHLVANPIDLAADDTEGRSLDAEVQAVVSRGPYVLWVGRSDPVYKRPDVCFDLAAKLPRFRFVMVLSPMDQAFHAELKRRKPANVDLIEGLSFRAMPHLFRAALTLVNTSAQEGFPNTFLQAGKYHVPVVSLNVDPDEMFRSRKAGIVCYGKLDVMAAAVADLVSNPERREQYADRLANYVAGHHELQRCCNELSDVIRRTVGGDDDRLTPGRAGLERRATPAGEMARVDDELPFARLTKTP